MAELHNLESIQELHADLLALSESRLSNIEKLQTQLVDHIKDFKALLDKKIRNNQSREALSTGRIELRGQTFTVNQEFQQATIEAADALDIDELDAAELLLEAEDESEYSGQALQTCSIIRFHQRRKDLLDCLRLILELSDDENQEEYVRDHFQEYILELVQPLNGTKELKSFIQRCLDYMMHIRLRLQLVAEKLINFPEPAPASLAEQIEITRYRRVSLIKQHELLGFIVLCLVKKNHSRVTEFESVLKTMREWNTFNNLLVHYFPALSAFISHFGGQDGSATMEDARNLNERIFPQTDQSQWQLVYVHAAVRSWWLAEYSCWYGEQYEGSLTQIQLEEESKHRSKLFTEALKDGAFDFILSLSADVKSSDWHDPARHGLRQWLQRRAPPLLSDSVEFSDFFQEALMEQLETFIESFITNMPDILRRLRVDEDEQRQLNSAQDHDLDLERFIVTISYAYEGRPKAAAEGFWGVPDGSLIGFMHWASRRASTPLVSSFCEMLQAISEDEECATAAHLFLLDEGAQGSGKIRRPHSLTWNQIFKELTFFSTKIRDRPAAPQTYGVGKPNNDLAEMEPESLMMLECYLRLITRLCTSSTTARQYLVQHPSFHLVDLSFQLASSSIQPRLKACAFTTLGSLIAHKTKEAGEHMWIALDLWVSGGFAPLSHMSKSQVPVSMAASASSSDRILKSLNTGFEEPNSFIQFLLALVLPNEDESGLHDGLPFPETLGITTRMPGIDRYIDFAIGQVFGDQIAELNDVVQIRLLQLTCLDFIGTCLGTFNEDLVIFANESNISIDIAIHASNLKSYVLLHPFARVMEWMFHEKVMKALFTAVHQDPAQIARSAPDSPLILCLLRSIRVIALILDLQPTYLDIVRPLVKIQSTHLRIPVSNASFASFEDGVLNHLSIIADLGLYCGMGQPELTLASLKLLEKLSASSRLASATGTGFGRRAERNKIIAALESENYSDTISKSLLHEMKSNIDLNLGRLDSAYIVKLHILDFLAACLRASPDQPTIAHVLLGFQCSNNLLDVDPHGPFIRGISLFHTILEVAVDTPVGEEINVVSSWLVSLRCKALDVLSLLWKSPLSSEFVMAEMRSNQSLFLLFVRQPTIKPETIWDGRSSRDPELLVSQSTSCVSDFLRQRSFTLQYVSSELRLVARGHLPSLKTRILGTLQGSTIEDDGQQTENFTIFDMFDFMELEFGEPISAPPLSWIKHADLDVCIERHEEPAASTHDLIKIHEILLLKRAELVKQNLLTDPQDAALVDSQIAETLEFYAINNQLNLFGASRLNLLRSWVQLVHVILESGELVGQDKILFVLRTLQTIQPSLESMLHIEKQATELARLAKSLVFSLDFDSEAFKMGDMGDLVSERLFHLFQVALRAIDAMGSHPALKELFYNISYRYLTGMSDVAGVSGIHLRHSIQTIKAAGDRFIDSVCDDAYGGDPLCRISALILLTALVQLAGREKSKYMVESLGRLNFINILVDSIQNFSNDLSQTAREDVNLHISYCNARLALLLRVSQSRFGATAVLNAGLFHSVRSSGLFVIDPDLGIEINADDAMDKHYELLASLMRVICAVVLSRGSQNEQTLDHGRAFLLENRLSVLAVLKKSAGIGTGSDSPRQSIDELAESYMLLMSVTGFLDSEDKTPKRPSSLRAFT